MARNLKTESEFGLPILPDPFGNPIAADATGAAAIPGFTDADAIKDGDQSLSLYATGHSLREIYALPAGDFGERSTGKAGAND